MEQANRQPTTAHAGPAGLKLGTSLLGALLAIDGTKVKKAGQCGVVLSPLGVQMALALALEGAAGDTAVQLRQAIGFSGGGDQAAVHDTLVALSSSLTSAVTTLAMANALWAAEDLVLDDAFLARAKELRAEASRVDFARATDNARTHINGWVAEKTNESIRDLLAPGSVMAETRLVITNAVHFKDQWMLQFDPDNTHPQDFHVLPAAGEDAGAQRTVSVKMMHNGMVRLRHGVTDAFSLVSLPFKKKEDIEMVVLLPQAATWAALTATRDALADLPEYYAAMSENNIDLKLPRFRVETERELSDVFRSHMGISEPFSKTSADFSALTAMNQEELMIDKIVHKAFLDVDEHGAEAAAATAITMKERSRMARNTNVPFVVDRPFVVALYHTRLHCALFAGVILDPSATGGSS